MAKTIIISLVASIYSVGILKIYLNIFLDERSGVRKIEGWLPFAVWQFFINSQLIPLLPEINLFLSCITMLIVGFRAYQGNLWKRLVFPLVCLAIWMLLEGIAGFAPGFFSDGKKADFLVISILSKILLFFVIMGIRFFAKRQEVGKEPYGGEPFFVILPISGMVLYQAFYILTWNAKNNQEVGFGWMLIAALSLIMLNLSFYPVYAQLMRNLYFKKNANLYMKQMELFKQEKELEEASAAEIRELRHNMKQQLIYLDELIKDNQINEVRKILVNLIGEVSTKGRLESRTGNLVIDSLINHTWKVALEKNLVFHAGIAPLPELSIKDADLCVLLGNALDNALEASEGLEIGKGEIWVSLNYAKGCLVIWVKNRYSGCIERSVEGWFCSKKREKGHGLGLYSMEKIAKRYQGSLNVETKDGLFSLEILICC